MSELYIGLMSGTSADGIDAALVDFSQPQPNVMATHYESYSASLRQKILALCQKGEDEIQRLGELDIMLGQQFAHAVKALLHKESIPAHRIKAIGSHGQTIRHAPAHFTLQIGDPNIIAVETGITTVADFRRKDIALAGQGAPLVPAFHHYALFSPQINRAIVNIGGIANVTLLPQTTPTSIVGFDTGPGNVLIDAWVHQHRQTLHDAEGAWAAQGNVHPELLTQLLADDYFQLAPPKSTGREYFNLPWLQNYLHSFKHCAPVDVQATLVELTARSIIAAVQKYLSHGEILVCGGGTHNVFLMNRLQSLAHPVFSLASTQKYGVNPDWVEATAFAWLARQTLNRQPGNLPCVTGAKYAVTLGGIYYSH